MIYSARGRWMEKAGKLDRRYNWQEVKKEETAHLAGCGNKSDRKWIPGWFCGGWVQFSRKYKKIKSVWVFFSGWQLWHHTLISCCCRCLAVRTCALGTSCRVMTSPSAPIFIGWWDSKRWAPLTSVDQQEAHFLTLCSWVFIPKHLVLSSGWFLDAVLHRG